MSAPAVKARGPVALRMATRLAGSPSKAWKACCRPRATAGLMAFRRSGRLMRMIEMAPRSAVVTADMACPPLAFVLAQFDGEADGCHAGCAAEVVIFVAKES